MQAPTLGPDGQAFWDEIVGVYGLSPAEMRLLSQVCKTLDILTGLDAAIATDGVMITGSKGQMVCNPAITEARGQRVTLHRLIAALAIPDADGKTVPTARTAATRAEWARRKIAVS
jgi:phage terminase small subunit